MSTLFVLLAIDTNPDPAPNEIWAFSRQAEAENYLRGWSKDFLYSHDDLPPDAALVEAFRKMGTRIHLYQCDLEGDSTEIVPFERVAEATESQGETMTNQNSIAKWIRRNKWVELDGTEREGAYIRDTHNLGVDELEALGHEALHVAAEWRKEIAERVPTPPTHKVFTFSCYGSDAKIATWVEHPWALVRVGKGTSVVFLVKEQNAGGSYQAWIVAAEKNVDGRLRWKRRFETSATVNQRDLIHVFPCALPYSPSLGDLERARAEAHARGASSHG